MTKHKHAHFTHSYLYKNNRNFLLIVDKKTGWKSVTNDIEWVIEKIIAEDGIDIETFVL